MHFATWKIWIALGLGALLVLFAIVWVLRWQGRSDLAGPTTPRLKGITSASFPAGGSIPSRYTCDGQDVSPALNLPAPPAGTLSLALVVDDPDTPFGFIHWLLYDVPAGTRDIAEAASPQGPLPRGSKEGVNDFGKIGYRGPCPPRGKTHHYRFRVYALDLDDLQPRLSTGQLAARITGHVLAQGQIVGSYARQNQ